jgi:hypothetical protein
VPARSKHTTHRDFTGLLGRIPPTPKPIDHQPARLRLNAPFPSPAPPSKPRRHACPPATSPPPRAPQTAARPRARRQHTRTPANPLAPAGHGGVHSRLWPRPLRPLRGHHCHASPRHQAGRQVRPQRTDPVQGDLSASVKTTLTATGQKIYLSGASPYLVPLGSTNITHVVTNKSARGTRRWSWCGTRRRRRSPWRRRGARQPQGLAASTSPARWGGTGRGGGAGSGELGSGSPKRGPQIGVRALTAGTRQPTHRQATGPRPATPPAPQTPFPPWPNGNLPPATCNLR